MADLFDQVKFYVGLAVFAYSVYSIWGVKKAGITPLGFGLPPLSDFGIGGGGAPPAEGPPAKSNVGWYYGRPVRDHGLDWSLTGWEKSEAVNRLTVA